ncbi:MAG: hypothetical protein U9Q68_06240 [Euryarchaeota archaeon]|nr:hypothetical protein [Euryarchaeota archaeon]
MSDPDYADAYKTPDVTATTTAYGCDHITGRIDCAPIPYTIFKLVVNINNIHTIDNE